MKRLKQWSTMARRLSAWTSLAVTAGMLGCGGDSGAPKKVTVYPVQGSVLRQDGKPLNGGHVYFVPKDGALTSEGTIGADGGFTLITGNSGAGAPSGEFKIRIEPSDPSIFATSKKGRAKTKPLPFAVKYLDEDTSGLVATIRAESNTLEPIRLK